MCFVWSQLGDIKTPPIVTSDFDYVRFIGDRSIQEKDFGTIQIGRKKIRIKRQTRGVKPKVYRSETQTNTQLMVKTQVTSSENMGSSETERVSCLTSNYFLTTNSPGYVNRLYKELIRNNPDNARVIRNYIEAEKVEINIKESTKADKIKKLCWLSRYLNHKSFNNMTKQDAVNYLDSIKKPESEDPGHRSIGTYNGIRIVLLKFFRWLYNPDESDHRKRTTPPCMNGIKEVRRKEDLHIDQRICGN